MPFEKGNTLGGKPKGSLNKVSKITKDTILDFLSDNRQQFEADMQQLTPLQRVKYTIQLMKFVVPQAKEIEITTNNVTPVLIELNLDHE